MTDGLYLKEAYLRTFEARLLLADPEGLLLDRTAFYPTGGGQPCDLGTLRDPGGNAWSVESVAKGPDGILHRVVEDRSPPSPGTLLTGSIDWPRRYAHMRYHTLLHILSGVVFHQYGSGITGGQFTSEGARMDFSLPDFSRELATALIDQVNSVVARDLPVSVRFVPRAQAQRDPNLVRVAAHLLPEVDELRLIDIEGFDVQADGGTHVRSTHEVGPATLEKLENKGAKNKRLYLKLGPSVPRPPDGSGTA
ncbi:MAG: alanyl-tRNA editing protein, partial [Candidatus Lutacidiplasmatales archaeon]